ncbi:MAG: phosphoribosyltransferase family protein, partial [Patescibacteria group bacterium]
ISNAEHTIISTDTRVFNKIILIDDALGSGATLNEVARKLKKNKNAKQVIGLAITGSFSGFEVISEV